MNKTIFYRLSAILAACSLGATAQAQNGCANAQTLSPALDGAAQAVNLGNVDNFDTDLPNITGGDFTCTAAGGATPFSPKAFFTINGANYPAGTVFVISSVGSTTPDGGIGINDTISEVYTGACGGLVPVANSCADDNVGLLSISTWTNDGSSSYTYVLGAYGRNSMMPTLPGYSYQISATATAPLPGDTCDDAIAIDNSDFPINDTWDGATNTEEIAFVDQNGAPLFTFQGPDRWYDFSATVNGTYDFTLTPADAGTDPLLGLIAFQACDNPVANFDPVAPFADTGLDGDPETLSRVMFNGDVYTFWLETFAADDAGDYTFSLVVTPGASVEDWEAY
jgi:hypothetical protein